MAQPIIHIENLSKEFKIGFKKRTGILAKVSNFFSGREPKRTLKVLDNISLKVHSGDILGIVGGNGSGKSTLLRIIGGIYKNYSGTVVSKGKIVPVIGLRFALYYRLDMKENIYIIGSLLGLRQREIKKKFESIVKFSDLEDFVNTKLYQFSNGMMQRLAFSMAIHSNPDILLLDEVFAVGDEKFRKRSAEKIKELVRNGAGVILVSHELWMVEKYCDRVILMEKGKIIREGPPKKIVKEYKEMKK